MKNILECFAISVFTLFSLSAQALGSKKPNPEPTQQPRPAPTPTPSPSPLPTKSPGGSELPVARAVDSWYGDDELLKNRMPASHAVDRCHEPDSRFFIDPIAESTRDYMTSSRIDLAGNESSFQLTKNPANVGLMSHPMCMVTRKSLSAVLRKVPDDRTIQKANDFVNIYNELRIKALRSDADAKDQLKHLWLRLMVCLGYTESLGTADTNTSKNVARNYAPSDCQKPLGVKFYYDRAQQNPASRLNIGVYQFSPDSKGNVAPCIREWNKRMQSKSFCQVSKNASKAELIRVLGSSRQVFNAFCGVSKIVQNFYTQVNTTAKSKTFPSNRSGDSLLRPQDRCVTMHFRSGPAYNHFGPLQNTTGDNMNEILSCALGR